MKNNRLRSILIILILIALVAVALLMIKTNNDAQLAGRVLQDALR